MSIREITSHRVNGVNERIRIFALDEPGAGGANHEYAILIPMKGIVIPDAWDNDSTIYDLGNGESVAVYPWHGVARTIVFKSDGSKSTQEFMLQRIAFQNGPVREAGVTGGTNEALLAVVIDRLEGFQRGQFACHDNEVALDHVQSARLWLHKRTVDRVARGVEGTLTR